MHAWRLLVHNRIDRLTAHIRAHAAALDRVLARAHLTLQAWHARLLIRVAHYRSARYMRSFFGNWARVAIRFSPVLIAHIVTGLFVPAAASGDDERPSKVPPFSGQREHFTAFIIAFSAYVAWKLTECADLLEGDEARPIPTGTGIPAANYDADGKLTNGAAIAAAASARPASVTNAADIADWDKRNKRLYGLLIQALPTWLKTSVYNSHRNDGVAAVDFLRAEFDAISEGDYATQLAALQRSVIDPRADLSDADLRAQYDHIMTACSAMQRTGHARPDDSLLKALLDNSLPTAYNTVRQLVRRSAHASFVAHYADYMTQVRAELASRAPTPRALQAHGGTGNGDSPPPSTPSGSLAVCLNCGDEGHTRQNCTKPKTKCSKCGARHKSSFCGNGSERPRLSDGARGLVDREAQKQKKGKEKDPAPQSYAAAASASASSPGGVVLLPQPLLLLFRPLLRLRLHRSVLLLAEVFRITRIDSNSGLADLF